MPEQAAAITALLGRHPRPWTVECYFDGAPPSHDNCGTGEPPEYCVRDSTGLAILDTLSRAEAMILASWPDLLGACDMVLKHIHDEGDGTTLNRYGIIDPLRAAVTKATADPEPAPVYEGPICDDCFGPSPEPDTLHSPSGIRICHACEAKAAARAREHTPESVAALAEIDPGANPEGGS